MRPQMGDTALHRTQRTQKRVAGRAMGDRLIPVAILLVSKIQQHLGGTGNQPHFDGSSVDPSAKEEEGHILKPKWMRVQSRVGVLARAQQKEETNNPTITKSSLVGVTSTVCGSHSMLDQSKRNRLDPFSRRICASIRLQQTVYSASHRAMRI